MTIRLASSILLALLTSVLVTACSDDGNGDPIDAMMGFPDCGCAAADAGPPDAYVEPPPPFSGGEGGELRLERFQLGPDDTDAELAAQALFFENQNPPARLLDGTVITIRAELQDQGYLCGDLSDGNNFDNGASPAAQAVVDSRDYFDVGATATLTNAGDATDVITLNRFLGEEDAAAATDRSAGLVHDILYKAPETTLVKRNATYLPDIEGSDEYSTLDLEFGQTAPGEELADPATGEGTPQIFMPSAFTMTSPPEADFYTAGALVFTRGQDLELTYTPAEAAPAGWPSIMRFIAFVNDEGMVEASCWKIVTGEPDDGEFTVPREVLEYVQADPGGRAVFGRMVHAAWETQPAKARLDLIGIESKVSPGFVIQDAPPARR
jgi:hypothetical protein